MELEEAVKRCYQIPGMCWPVELGTLYELFKGSMDHVEVGAFCGRSLFVSAMALGLDAQLTIVEPFIGCHVDQFPMPGPDWHRSVLSATIDAIRYHRPDLQITCLEQRSVQAMRLIGRKVETAYIDGDHHFAECSADIQGWSPIVLGTLAGHDYWPTDPGVMEAVQSSLVNFRIVPDTRIWVRL